MQIINIIKNNDVSAFHDYINHHNINDELIHGRNLCYYVINNNNKLFLEILISKGLNLTNNVCGSALHQAVMENKFDIYDILIKYIDINITDDFEWTPLHYAIQNNSTKSVLFLINNGANINAQEVHGYTPLHLAIKYGYLEIITILLKNDKSDILLKDSKNLTPLLLAKKIYNEYSHISIYEGSEKYKYIIELLSTK